MIHSGWCYGEMFPKVMCEFNFVLAKKLSSQKEGGGGETQHGRGTQQI